MVIAIYAVIEGFEFSSYYIFYGSLFFALVYVSSFRWVFERASGRLLRAAGYRRRAVLVGSGSHIDAVAHALRESREVEPFGFVSLSTRSSESLRDFGSLENLERNFDAIDEVLIADPDFPQDEAVELVDRCHRHGVRVRVAPSTMEILMDRVEFVPGQSLPLFELKPPVFEGVDFVVKRAFDLVGVGAAARCCCRRVLLAIAIAIKLDSRGPVLFRSMRPGIGGSPFPCLKFRTMSHGAEQLQDELEEHNEMAGALFKIREDPRVTRVGALPAPLVARRAAPAVQRAARRDVAGRAAAAARARLRAPRGLAPQALPRAAGHDRAVAGVGPLRARLRRARAPGLPLPRALVGVPRPHDPAEDHPRRDPGHGAW